MAKKRDRAFAMFFAILFLFSSCALTGAVIYQMLQDNKPETGADSTIDSAQNKEAPVDENSKLQGKPLAGFAPIAKIEKLSGLDSAQGTGPTVKASDTVTVDYTGAVAATGIVFQSSKDTGQPVSFALSGVIAGWSQGIPGMKEGGTRRLLIPASLAYGANPPSGSGIPANADLVFDVTVHKIVQ